MALSGATIPGQSGPGSNGNEGVLRIPQSSSITGTSPSDCLVLYPGHLLGEVLTLSREAVGVFYSPKSNSYVNKTLSNCKMAIIFSEVKYVKRLSFREKWRQF